MSVADTLESIQEDTEKTARFTARIFYAANPYADE